MILGLGLGTQITYTAIIRYRSVTLNQNPLPGYPYPGKLKGTYS